MRIRSIKPEFWRSTDISGLAIEDRLLFIGIWSYVDDNGVGFDKLSAITADLFADDLEEDPQGTFARVSRGLQHLSTSGRILRYTVENTKYLSVVNWSKHQRIDRPGKARHPQYSGDPEAIRESVASLPVNDSPGAVDQGTGEQGIREQFSSSDAEASDPGFDEEPLDEPEAERTFPDSTILLCNYLADKIQANGNKVGKIGIRWHQAMDRLERIDGYAPDQIQQVIDWSQQNEFWQGNILSAAKLREKFDQLKTRMFQERTNPPSSGNRSTDRMMNGYQAMAGFNSNPQPDPWAGKELTQ